MNTFQIHKLDAISDRTKHAPATDVLAELSSVLYAIEKNPEPVNENTKTTTNNEKTSGTSTKSDENNENKKSKEENQELSISIFRPYFVQPESCKKKVKSKISDNEDKDKTSSSTDKNKGKEKGKTPGKTGEKIFFMILSVSCFCVDGMNDINMNIISK
jgi:hypothetical protein